MLQGKTALITGAGKGIGRAIALRFAKEGADVIINYSGSEAAAAECAKECEALGARTFTVKADVSDMAQVESMFAAAIEEFDKVDILVNNAGITKDGIILRMKEEDFDSVVDINLKGTFNCMKAASKLMLKKRSGRIISISSIVGIRGNAGQVNYSASKAGIIGMTKSLARELASKGITVNAVAPGFIETDMTSAMPEKARESFIGAIPAGRMGSPEDIAGAVLFFAGPDASYVTGQVLTVDGGMI